MMFPQPRSLDCHLWCGHLHGRSAVKHFIIVTGMLFATFPAVTNASSGASADVLTRCHDVAGGGRSGADIGPMFARNMACRSARTVVLRFTRADRCYVGSRCRVGSFLCSTYLRSFELSPSGTRISAVRCVARTRSFAMHETTRVTSLASQ